jgi:hypothetical protein
MTGEQRLLLGLVVQCEDCYTTSRACQAHDRLLRSGARQPRPMPHPNLLHHAFQAVVQLLHDRAADVLGTPP